MSDPRTFRNFALFDGVQPALQEGCWLQIANGQIQRVGRGPLPSTDEAVDLRGYTIVPGLIDAHVHLGVDFAPEANLRTLFSLHRQIRLNLANCIRSGVTTVRDMGSTPGLIRRMKRWIGEGRAIGPRIICTNSFIIPPGAMPQMVPTFPLPLRLLLGGQAAERVNTPDKVRDAVRRMVALGADWIKTTHSDKSIFLHQPDPPVFDDACFEALVDEAHRQHRPVAMHQTQATGFRKALALGVESMEHAPLDALTDDEIAQAAESGIPIVPTMRVMRECLQLDRIASWLNEQEEGYLCPESLRQTRELLGVYQGEITPQMAREGYYVNRSLHERQIPVMMENVRRLYDAGVTIGCGTDSGGTAFSVFGRCHEEIENLLEIGLSPFEALRSATAVNARILRMEDKLGSIEPGKLADFVAVDGNPLVDIEALRRVRIVVKEGRVLHREGVGDTPLAT